MDERLQKIVEEANVKFGLDAYELEEHSIYRERDNMGEAYYTFRMTWYPKVVTELIEDGTLPLGTAFIYYSIQEEMFTTIIFAAGTSYSTVTPFPSKTIEEVGAWLEQETGFVYGKDVKLVGASVSGFSLAMDIDGIQMSPSCTIEFNFDDTGKLTRFHWDGINPPEDRVKKSGFMLTLEEIEPLVKKQLQLVELPSDEKECFVSVYAMDEVYVTVDGARIIPFVIPERSEVEVGKLLEWNETLELELHRKEIPYVYEASIEEAFGHLGTAEKLTLTDEQIDRTTTIVCDVMRSELPDESGEWTLKSIGRDETLIFAFCAKNEESLSIVKRKVVVKIDPETMTALDFFDNEGMLGLGDLFDSFAPAEKAVVTHAEAFEKMVPYITLDPMYVYDELTGKYILCGLLDAAEAVDAVTGEVISLADL